MNIRIILTRSIYLLPKPGHLLRPLQKTEVLTGYTNSAAYNDTGLVQTTTDPNNTTFSFLYDELNRVTSQSSSQGNSFQSVYYANPFGIHTVTANDGRSNTYTYDDLGRPQAVATKVADGTTNTVNYNYDPGSRLTSITDPSGNITGYQYQNDTNRVQNVSLNGTSIATYDWRYSYFNLGKVDDVDSNRAFASYSYDDFGRVKQVVNYAKNTLGTRVKVSEFDYHYDADGNIDSVTEQYGSDSAKTTAYDYDELDRLKTITGPDGKTVNYTYDVRGNRSISVGSVPQADKVDTDYVYDEWNQLKQVTRGGKTISFEYDANGLRTKKVVTVGTTSDTTRYVYDGAGRLITEKDASNNLKASYIWGPDRLIAKKDSTGNLYYYLYNAHGDVTEIVDSNGNVVNEYHYDAWGRITDSIENIPNDFKYAGETFDSETGLYYLRARYYDPTTGRFISKDSEEGDIWNPLSQNLFTYCWNMPLNHWDPTGHLTAWDKANVPQEYWDDINNAGTEYNSATNDQQRAAAHQRAENIRNQYRGSNEVGLPDGNTVYSSVPSVGLRSNNPAQSAANVSATRGFAESIVNGFNESGNKIAISLHTGLEVAGTQRIFTRGVIVLDALYQFHQKQSKKKAVAKILTHASVNAGTDLIIGTITTACVAATIAQPELAFLTIGTTLVADGATFIAGNKINDACDKLIDSCNYLN